MFLIAKPNMQNINYRAVKDQLNKKMLAKSKRLFARNVCCPARCNYAFIKTQSLLMFSFIDYAYIAHFLIYQIQVSKMEIILRKYYQNSYVVLQMKNIKSLAVMEF